MPTSVPLHRSAALLMAFVLAGTTGFASTDVEAAVRRVHHIRKIRANEGSGETVRERERRLQRECRGRPNAGACLGFGQ